MVVMSLLMVGLLAVSGGWESADAALVTQVELTSGAANWDGKKGRMLDRLLGQGGTVTLGHYQSWPDIVDPISKGHKTYSLFTSGLNGAPAPAATIDGVSITMDLTSLFPGWQRGDESHAWNIGGMAKGLFNPQTAEFQLSWDHLIIGEKYGHRRDHLGTVFLQEIVFGGTPAAVPLAASVFLFGTGGVLLGFWFWMKRRGQVLGRV
jgi:hypothetical protein